MGVPRGRRTKSKQGHRRSHLKLAAPVFSKCPRCGAAVLPHQVCANCGYYRGRQVINVLAKLTKKDKKRKEKELAEARVEADTRSA